MRCDRLQVDAERGIVTILSHTPPANGSVPLPTAAVVGGKAHNLGVVHSLGFAVPEFVALPANEVRHLVNATEGAPSLAAVVRQLTSAAARPPGDPQQCRQ